MKCSFMVLFPLLARKQSNDRKLLGFPMDVLRFQNVCVDHCVGRRGQCFWQAQKNYAVQDWLKVSACLRKSQSMVTAYKCDVALRMQM